MAPAPIIAFLTLSEPGFMTPAPHRPTIATTLLIPHDRVFYVLYCFASYPSLVNIVSTASATLFLCDDGGCVAW